MKSELFKEDVRNVANGAMNLVERAMDSVAESGVLEKGAEIWKNHQDTILGVTVPFISAYGLPKTVEWAIKLQDKINPDIMAALRQESNKKLMFNSSAIPMAGFALTERNRLLGTTMMAVRGGLLGAQRDSVRRKSYREGFIDGAKVDGLESLSNRLHDYLAARDEARGI